MRRDATGKVQDLPDGDTAEGEGAAEPPGGQRSVKGSGRERGKGGDDVRGSEVLCLRHGGRLSEAGEDAQHGSILSQETLVHPSQALDLSQNRESLHRGRESCREGAGRRSVQGGGEGGCTQEDSHRKISASAVKYIEHD